MNSSERMASVSAAWERNRNDLLRYVRRLVIDPDAAEDIVQTAGLRAVAAERSPDGDLDLRKWLFRIASNLAIDELRRRGTWAETALLDSRTDAEADSDFVAASIALRGTQDGAAIAREHLAFCFACTLRSFSADRAASLLLVELYGFTVAEAADVLGASVGQVKNWLQETRASVAARHADRCALVSKKGVCHQCSELAEFFDGAPQNPLEGTAGGTEDRLRIMRSADERDLSAWHRRLSQVIERRARERRA
ncbi:MAG TPA: RNA polymerase sigma factor [Thermoanaerobaculia bacterium]|nr:RNA polymerase sigma factor [Thermoanaerobaculia bacterium]